MVDEMLDVIKEAIKLPALLKDIYGDLLKPGVKQLGKALETVLGLGNTILLPLALLNEKTRITLQLNLDKYREQLQNLPEESIALVPPEIGIPIVEKLTYVLDDELSALYVNLLAKASTVHTNDLAHPGFVNVINCLCPDEVIFLRELYKRDPLPFVSASLFDKKIKSLFQPIEDLLTGVEKEISLLFPDNAQAYISNFEGLGLIHVRRDIYLDGQPFYDALEKLYRPQYESLPFDKKKKKLEFKKGKIDVTPYGNMFMKACLSGLLKEIHEINVKE